VGELVDVPYGWVKAFHIIAVIAWMAGMLYLPRLFDAALNRNTHRYAHAAGSDLPRHAQTQVADIERERFTIH
jgi:uncharacterized membrane protein